MFIIYYLKILNFLFFRPKYRSNSFYHVFISLEKLPRKAPEIIKIIKKRKNEVSKSSFYLGLNCFNFNWNIQCGESHSLVRNNYTELYPGNG
ncbi:hypothetical protein BpHYR1_008227 [Brachionus plicatilis]|uniref:Uncharacterized protein n=1 Tax=Brachionus plicatilis TaxID=10195 RepID=A0A3M7RM01_BRAPC|nr:hypothetical protein BpHYR1_008227 [Brachionus plicatilis]